jgi:hypothetical protein
METSSQACKCKQLAYNISLQQKGEKGFNVQIKTTHQQLKGQCIPTTILPM